VSVFGPITQEEFLRKMGVDARLAILLQNSTDEALSQNLVQGFSRLVEDTEMGRIYKVMAIVNSRQFWNSPPPAFDEATKI